MYLPCQSINEPHLPTCVAVLRKDSVLGRSFLKCIVLFWFIMLLRGETKLCNSSEEICIMQPTLQYRSMGYVIIWCEKYNYSLWLTAYSSDFNSWTDAIVFHWVIYLQAAGVLYTVSQAIWELLVTFQRMHVTHCCEITFWVGLNILWSAYWFVCFPSVYW